ncbi:MAG: hypothetical protein RBR04_07340 [Candidatus Syntrophosphaera sp.]|jgi:hypothetical protein|nr:hypothetical protein [Candidatus Syntrophosphaera sp.]
MPEKEMLYIWPRDHGVISSDMGPLFIEQAKLRAEKLGVAAGYISGERGRCGSLWRWENIIQHRPRLTGNGLISDNPLTLNLFG